MKLRALIIEDKLDEEPKFTAGDSLILIQQGKSNEIYSVELTLKRKAKTILLVYKLTALQQYMIELSAETNSHLLRYLEKGKCEVVAIDYNDECVW